MSITRMIRPDTDTDTNDAVDPIAPRRGNWMQTYTGGRFWPLDPHVEDIEIIDIAHSLSMQCRYNGHTQVFMSVAEHCVLMSRLVSAENALWALLHDATETYVGDMIRPLKLDLPNYRTIEDRVMLVIAEKFGLQPQMPFEVHDADMRIVLDERDALLAEPAEEWDLAGEPFGIDIPAWPPAQAELEYITRFAELTGDPMTLKRGLCGDRNEHKPHVHRSDSLGVFWCSADQTARLPWAAERRLRAEREGGGPEVPAV